MIEFSFNFNVNTIPTSQTISFHEKQFRFRFLVLVSIHTKQKFRHFGFGLNFSFGRSLIKTNETFQKRTELWEERSKAPSTLIRGRFWFRSTMKPFAAEPSSTQTSSSRPPTASRPPSLAPWSWPEQVLGNQ